MIDMTAKEHFLRIEDKQLREVLLSNLEKYDKGWKNNYSIPTDALVQFNWELTEQGEEVWHQCWNRLTFQPYYDKYGKSEDANPLDESELRKKAQLTHESHYKSLVPLSNIGYECMLDFAKYYHSIQAKESKEGKFIVLYDSTMPNFDSFEEAVQRAKGKNDKHLQIFKLVAEVEKVTTINVKDV